MADPAPGPAPDPKPAAAIPDAVKKWNDASSGVTAAATWMITALAAVAAVLFAKGLVTTPELDWSDKQGRDQLLWAWALGAAALAAIGVLVMAFVRLLLPVVYTLSTLPAAFKTEVDAHSDWYLPSESDNLEEFKIRLLFHRHVAASARRLVEKSSAAVADLQKEVDAESDATKRADLQRQLTDQQALLAVAKDGLADASDNLSTYEECRDALLSRAVFWTRGGAFEIGSEKVVTAAVVAALCGVGYQLVLSHPDDAKEDDDGTSASSASTPALPAVGELMKASGSAGDDLWTSLHLADCHVDGRASIDVLVLKGAGTPEDPYQVSTMPLGQSAVTDVVNANQSGTCTTRIFNVINDAARVTFEPVTTITYAPSPTPTGSSQ